MDLVIMGRSAIAFFTLFLLARLLGPRQIAQLTFFDYVVGITIGSVAAVVSINTALPIGQGLTSLILWCLLAFGLAYLVVHLKKGRSFIIGQPDIVIKSGMIQQDVMAKQRLDMDELNLLLRREKIFDITDVEYAVFEPNGKLSVLKRDEQQNVSRKDMNLPAPALKYLPTELIVDGRVVERSLTKINHDQGWLEDHIKAQGYSGMDDIFYAELLSDGSIYLEPKNKPVQSGGEG